MAVFLGTDLYDHNDDPNTISVTSLIKPIKQTILSSRVPPGTSLPDISGKVKSQAGTAVHTAIEWAWVNNFTQAMLDLGYKQETVDKVRVNPTKLDIAEAEEYGHKIIPIYMERRSEKSVAGMKVSGKFDFVVEGNLEDFKNTSTYTYVKKTNDWSYILQGSMYRWLNQDIITGPDITIQYIFSDWSAAGFKQNPNKYPPHAAMSYSLPLLSIADTEIYVTERIRSLRNLWDKDESEIPICTDKELWRDAPVWKYYKNPAKRARSTKNFDNIYEANTLLSKDGGVGIVVEVPGKVKACAYCDAYTICKQKDNYLLNGTLKI